MGRTAELPFKPRARLLHLLGDQLIRDPAIAVFELVKNAYDADATNVLVTFHDITDQSSSSIVVEDDGCGMDFETVTGVWLQPGTDYRDRQRKSVEARTSRFHRLPMGEKGIGRFAVDKLGRAVEIVTRRAGCPEVVFTIDWDALTEREFLDEALVQVVERDPEWFEGDASGTRIVITSLRDQWTRGMLRGLHRQVMSICSPFAAPGDFQAEVELDPDPGWLEELLDFESVKDLALYHAHMRVENGQCQYTYRFSPYPGMRDFEPRQIEKSEFLDMPSDAAQDVVAQDLIEVDLGPFEIELFMFERDPAVLALSELGDRRGFRTFMKQNGGVRVYRDGIRVFDYGEPGDDWLGLDATRVGHAGRNIGNEGVLGAVQLTGDQSFALVEKTNREGFVEDRAFRTFRAAVQSAVTHVNADRLEDSHRVRQLYGVRRRSRQPVLEPLARLREELQTRGLERDLGTFLTQVETDFLDLQERLLTAAGTGLGLAVVVHEVEKSISSLVSAIQRDAPLPELRELAVHLSELVDGLGFLMRRSRRRKESAAQLVRNALSVTRFRLDHHRIGLLNAFDAGASDFKVQCVRRLTVATLVNLIDNSIHWLKLARRSDARIWIGPSEELGAPAIVVADNGPGFSDPPETLVLPFFTRRPEGMGIGLHLADEVMKSMGGRLAFPSPADVGLPEGIEGAVVALLFGGDT